MGRLHPGSFWPKSTRSLYGEEIDLPVAKRGRRRYAICFVNYLAVGVELNKGTAMRQDAKTLLDRLDRHYLDYQDFTAVAEEIELWPLFQTLLRDPRIVGNREQSVPASGSASADTTLAAAQEATPAAPRSPSAEAEARPTAGLFGRYGRAAAPAPMVPEPAREPDLRNFLHDLGKGRA